MSSREPLVEEAYQRALDVLRRCVTPYGFRASGLSSGYPQIWARDSMITSLGAVLTGDPDLLAAFRASLDTLGSHQSSLGLIPLNVLPETGEVSTENAGAVDANLWFILGHYYHFLHTRDLAYLQANWPRIERAVLWLRYQDMNECGLLEVPEAGDWMDLLAVRYNVLYDNVLYGAALRAAGDMAAITGHVPDVAPSAAADVFERLNLLLWVDRCWVASHFAEHLEKLKALRLEWYMLYHNVGTISSRPFYLPYVAFREYGDYCDTLGNLLAVLCGLADEHRADQILRYLYQVGVAQPVPDEGDLPADLPRQPRLARVLPQPQPQPAAPVPQRRHLALHRRLPHRGAGQVGLEAGGRESPGRSGCRQPAWRARRVGVQRMAARRDRPSDGLPLSGLVSRDVRVRVPRRQER